MMRTVILTTQQTTLSIQTSEPLKLEAMAMPGQTSAPAVIALSAGANNVTVNAGVFKVVSNNPVGVGSPSGTVQVLATATKDGNWPDPQMAMKALGIDTTALKSFVPADGRGL